MGSHKQLPIRDGRHLRNSRPRRLKQTMENGTSILRFLSLNESPQTMPPTSHPTVVGKSRKENSASTKNAVDDMSFERVSASASYLLERTEHRPRIAVICGSGLAGLADLLQDPDVFPYEDIPHFPQSTVPGHKSRLLFGKLKGVSLMLMQGRFHHYEGYTLGKTAMPVRMMKLCGIEALIVTNAAGALNPRFGVGDIMMIKDHINIVGMAGQHPLKGPNDSRFGTRFFALNDCYARKWRQLGETVGRELQMEGRLHQGVYTMLGGPNYETVAELKMLKMCGVDAVGMSTIPEVLTAVHCEISVFAFSLITNKCVFDEDEEGPNHEEVIEAANHNKESLSSFVTRMVEGISADLPNNNTIDLPKGGDENKME